jgi:putative thioredoxin
MEPILKSAPPEASAVKDSNTASFMADVIEGSRENIVLVDFWAPWCGPCKQLSPILEREVALTKGAVRLVKINIDENPDLAREMHVQSIPAVYAFYQGRPVDGFMGALPESQVKAFLERMVRAVGGELPAAALSEVTAEADAMLAAGDIPGAEQLYREVLAADAKHAGALAGTVRSRIQAGDIAAARKIIDRIPAELSGAPEIAAARSALELVEQRPDANAVRQAQEKLAANANDHPARYDLAAALYADGKSEEAVDQLIEIVKRDRNWNDQAARTQLLKLFEALGPAHPVAMAGRRKLSSVLFK